MLTKSDLAAIEKLLDKKLDQKLNPVQKDLKAMSKDVRKLKKDVSVIVKFFDRKSVSVEKDVKHIKERLGMPTTS